MVKDAQVGVLRRKRMEGKTQEASAGAAGMSVRSARKWEHGLYPSQRRKPHTWRTREDPFAELFDTEVAALLVEDRNGVLEATTILAELNRRHPGRFGAGQLRTLQRRVRQWRGLNGPEKEVFFPQEHPPGREARNRLPVKRFGTDDKIAGLVAYLASPEAGFVTGASLTIDGGYLA